MLALLGKRSIIWVMNTVWPPKMRKRKRWKLNSVYNLNVDYRVDREREREGERDSVAQL